MRADASLTAPLVGPGSSGSRCRYDIVKMDSAVVDQAIVIYDRNLMATRRSFPLPHARVVGAPFGGEPRPTDAAVQQSNTPGTSRHLPTVLSAFSGAGGLDLGLESTESTKSVECDAVSGKCPAVDVVVEVVEIDC